MNFKEIEMKTFKLLILISLINCGQKAIVNNNQNALLQSILTKDFGVQRISEEIKSLIYIPDGILATGQSKTVYQNDDGSLKKGISRDFNNIEKSGLVWQKCGAGQNNDSTCSGELTLMNYSEANSYCESSTFANKKWRLPSIYELSDLINVNNMPTIDVIFQNVSETDDFFVSSSLSNNEALYISLETATTQKENKDLRKFKVRCVSGSVISNNIETQSTTLSDSKNKLIWQKCAAGQNQTDCSGTANTYSLFSALSYCQNLNSDSKNNWRLPNLNELKSLLNNVKDDKTYLSSTTQFESKRFVQGVKAINFSNKNIINTNDNYYIRCVNDL